MSQTLSPQPTPRVVVAEDDTLLLEAFSRLLAPNFEVVGDGDEAVSVALRVKPDLVLLDARMPRSSGFEAARPPIAPAHGLTACSSPVQVAC